MNGDLAIAMESAREAGAAVLKFFKTKLVVRDKGNDNPVTAADLEADRILKSRLLAERPEYGWLSEETADSTERLSRRRVWVVDPIDGTKEFIRGVPEFAVSVGLVDDGIPVVGVVYNPATNEMFWAEKNGGAFKDGEAIRVSATQTLSDAMLEASRTEFDRGRFEKIRKSVLRIEPIGSIAYKLARVASGQADIVFSYTPKSEWDLCGAAAIIEAAGGRISLPTGTPMLFNRAMTQLPGVAATNGILHDKLIRLIQED